MKTVLFLTDDYWHHADTIRPLADILFPPAEYKGLPGICTRVQIRICRSASANVFMNAFIKNDLQRFIGQYQRSPVGIAELSIKELTMFVRQR